MTKRPLALIVVDGLRPDALLQAATPTLQRLMLAGAYTLDARTVLPSLTLPCMASLIFGVVPLTHGLLTNTAWPPSWAAPGVIDILHNAGYRTGAFINWAPLRELARPDAVDVSVCLNLAESRSLPLGECDTALTALTLTTLAHHPVDFIFFYLGGLDTAGHTFGWMSAEYLRTLENADHCVGRLLAGLPPDVTVFITADHGGQGRTHGFASDAEMTIPLIIAGPGWPTGNIPGPVSLVDIAPTLAACAGLLETEPWQGKTLPLPSATIREDNP
jgi:predicted AlkP superfamily pyrophosphatase or phosphodiesterase